MITKAEQKKLVDLFFKAHRTSQEWGQCAAGDHTASELSLLDEKDDEACTAFLDALDGLTEDGDNNE